jgi:polyphosphate glucokinase
MSDDLEDKAVATVPSVPTAVPASVPAGGPGPGPSGAVPVAGAPAAGSSTPVGPLTLAIDIGGTGLKASVLDANGAMVADRVLVKTTYPLPPTRLVDDLAALVAPLPATARVSAGFPGMVRKGRVLSAPHFVTEDGPGTKVDDELVKQWADFDLAGALRKRLGKPTKVANDADIQGAAVVDGKGLELVITLGTGVGTALFYDGRLLPHLEFAHHPFRKGETYNGQLGDATRKEIGNTRWNKRVRRAIETMRALTFFDHCYIGGGNAKHLTGDLGDQVSTVDNTAGILGGIKLWGNRQMSL